MNKICGVLGVALLLGTAGCSSDSNVDIGDGKTGEKLSDYSDTWQGYAEAYTFADGSDKIVLVLDENGEGVITFGEAEAPTDVAHLPSWATGKIVPGFGYSVQFTTVEASRLRFGYDLNESVAQWCSEQTPYLYNPENDYWACVPRGSFGGISLDSDCWITPEDTGVQTPIGCNALTICEGQCFCTSESCSTTLASPTPTVRVDGALKDSGDSLEGTLVVTDETKPVIRLTRQ